MSLSYYVLFHFFYVQHVSDINNRHQKPATFLLYHHIGRVFLFRCVLEFRCGWVGVVSVQQAEHVSDINTSIIRSLRLFYCITTMVVCSVKMEIFSISVNYSI